MSETIDGYLLRAIKAGPNVIVYVLDTPVVFMFAAFNIYGPGSWPTMTGGSLPNRDTALPTSAETGTKELIPVTSTADNFLFFSGHAFHASPGTFTGVFHENGGGAHSGQYAANATITRSLSDPGAPNSEYQMLVELVSGMTKAVKADSTSVLNPNIATQQLYVWTDGYLSDEAGEPDLHLSVRTSSTMMWAAYSEIRIAVRPEPYPLRAPTVGQRLVAPRTFFASNVVFQHTAFTTDPATNGEVRVQTGIACVSITPFDQLLEAGEYVIAPNYVKAFMLRDLGIPELVPEATHVLDGEGNPEDPTVVQRNIITTQTTSVGNTGPQRVVFACTVDKDDTDVMENRYQKKAHYVISLRADTGALRVMHSMVWAVDAASATFFGLPLEPDITTIYSFCQCHAEVLSEVDPPVLVSYVTFNRMLVTTVATVWPAIQHTDTDFVLLNPVDDVETVTGLRAAGYTAIMPKYNGDFSLDGNNDAYGFSSDASVNVAFYIGGGQIGVLATNQQTSDPQEISLVVIDSGTGEFIESRGVIGSFPASVRLDARGSCVLEQTVTDAPMPVVTSEAVILVNVNAYDVARNEQYVSTDGGRTWVMHREFVSGVPYYLGNMLHPAFIGKSI
jgi:hypothetical protein